MRRSLTLLVDALKMFQYRYISSECFHILLTRIAEFTACAWRAADPCVHANCTGFLISGLCEKDVLQNRESLQLHSFEALMSQIWVDGVAVATRCSQLSTHLGQDGVILYWDEGQMEIIGEGICSAEDENQDSTNSSFIHKAPHYKLEEDNSQKSLVLSEDRPHDKEMARCLTTLNSLPHVPKINADIPAQKVASEDHQRLLDRLSLYGLSEQKIEGDGNCQFRALSDQLYHSPEYHNFVRDSVVKQLRMTPDAYSGYVQMEYGDYLEKMAKSGEWGDHVTLQAAADYYGVRISLVTSFKDTCFIEIVPTQQKSKQEIYLSFWAEVHYNSIHTLRILQ